MLIYRLMADLVIVIHFLWILFILFGFLLALKYQSVVFIHMVGLVFTLILNIGGWYCPLTHLEIHLQRQSSPDSLYIGSFITHYLERIIYLRVDASHLRIGAIAWVSLNLGGYAILLGRKFRKRKLAR
jgi:hypothetical protein